MRAYLRHNCLRRQTGLSVAPPIPTRPRPRQLLSQTQAPNRTRVLAWSRIRVLPALNNHNASRTMQQPRTYIQHTIIQSACACATIMHTASTHTVSTHTISQHVIRIQLAHNHAAARTLSPVEAHANVTHASRQHRQAVKQICDPCTHSLATLTITLSSSAHLVAERRRL